MSEDSRNAACDIEAEMCSLAVVGASVTLSFLGINGERVTVTMPPIMLESLAQSIAGVRREIVRGWSPDSL